MSRNFSVIQDFGEEDKVKAALTKHGLEEIESIEVNSLTSRVKELVRWLITSIEITTSQKESLTNPDDFDFEKFRLWVVSLQINNIIKYALIETILKHGISKEIFYHYFKTYNIDDINLDLVDFEQISKIIKVSELIKEIVNSPTEEKVIELIWILEWRKINQIDYEHEYYAFFEIYVLINIAKDLSNLPKKLQTMLLESLYIFNKGYNKDEIDMLNSWKFSDDVVYLYWSMYDI